MATKARQQPTTQPATDPGTRWKVVIDHDPAPDWSWLEQDMYDPSKPGYEPIYPTKADMQAKRNAYDGDWYRNPKNHVALQLVVYRLGPDDEDWTVVDALGGIDFLTTSDDWKTGTFYALAGLKGCSYLQELARDAGMQA